MEKKNHHIYKRITESEGLESLEYRKEYIYKCLNKTKIEYRNKTKQKYKAE